MTKHPSLLRGVLGALSLVLAVSTAARPAGAQFVQEYEQFYLPASHNWQFRDNYMSADRLFNAFDYGHSILYEELLTRPGAPVARLEEREFDRLTRRILINPPRVPLAEAAIEVEYAKLAPEAKNMFHWAHLLHRQAYDVWADERLTPAQKDAAMAEVLAYYKTRPDLAFSSLPKSMELMDGQHYSLAFRERYPKFNGLIWAYHWLQVGLYEPLLVGSTLEERKAGVDATVGRFWQLISDAPRNMPYLMPMTAAVAPRFAERYPEVAIIFDNLHMMHDVVSDILASPEVPRERKRAEIVRAAELFRDSTSYLTTVEQWKQMAEMMGLNNMGGPAVGFTAALPTPTVERGMSMAGMDHAAAGHGAHADRPTDTGGMTPTERLTIPPDSGAHQGHPQAAAPDDPSEALRELHERMLADPVIRGRVEADSVLRRLRDEVRATPESPAAHSGHQPASDADRAAALDFAVRLLSDPEVAARIHTDPRLHALWSDPEVQRRLAELRARREPAHRH